MRRIIAPLLLLLLMRAPASAFICEHTDDRDLRSPCLRWTEGSATVRSLLGSAGTPLLNGTLSWDQNSINAANDWNLVGASFRFTVDVGGQFIDPCGAPGPGHACFDTGPAGDSPVFFADSFCGRGFGTDIVQLTNTCYLSDGSLLNAPVFVNSSVRWDAYDGPIRFAGPDAVNDIRRVLLHEFGHVLGLGHPDVAGQNVGAIMNSQESDIDRLQPDDKNGIFSLYPNAGPAPSGQSGAPGTNTGCAIAAANGSDRGWVWLAVVAIAALRRIGRCSRS